MEKTKNLSNRAKEVTPGGIHSAGWMYWTPFPPFIQRGKGSKIYDVNGTEYIDYILAYGPLILGHAHPRIVEAVTTQLQKGTAYGLPTELAVEVAEKITKQVPCADMVLFHSTGSDAVLAAIRLARAYAGKSKILKFEGHYHGWGDSVFISQHPPLEAIGSEKAPIKIPASAGIPQGVLNDTLVVPWNDLKILENTIRKHEHDLAAVITEPYMSNSGCIPPEDGYLEAMRELTQKHDIVLIFDEIITGFRYGLGGVQQYYGVTPDLCTLGKALGGGFPISAIAGKEEIMEMSAPGGGVPQVGTFNANPLCLAAARATLEELEAGNGRIYREIFSIGNRLIDGLRSLITQVGVDAIVQGLGPGWQIFFTKNERIRNYREARQSNDGIWKGKYHKFWEESMARGIMIHPRHLSHQFLSAAHTNEDIDRTLIVLEEALKAVRSSS